MGRPVLIVVGLLWGKWFEIEQNGHHYRFSQTFLGRNGMPGIGMFQVPTRFFLLYPTLIADARGYKKILNAHRKNLLSFSIVVLNRSSQSIENRLRMRYLCDLGLKALTENL